MENSKKTKKLLAALSCLAMIENAGGMKGRRVYAGNTLKIPQTAANNTNTAKKDPKTTITWKDLARNVQEIACPNCDHLNGTVKRIKEWGKNPFVKGRLPEGFRSLMVVPNVNDRTTKNEQDMFDKLTNLLPVFLADRSKEKESINYAPPEQFPLTIYWSTAGDIVEESCKNIESKWITKAGNATIVINLEYAMLLKCWYGKQDADVTEEKKTQRENQINNFINNHNETWKCPEGDPIQIARLEAVTILVENLEKVLKGNKMSTTKKVIIGGITAIGICAIGYAGYYFATKNGQSKLKKDSQKTVPTGAQENSHKGKN